MDTQKKFEIFSYLSIGGIAFFLVLMLTESIPASWFVPILIFSLILLSIRFAFRFYFIFKKRNNNKE